MARTRILGYVFSGIFSLGSGLIGFTLTRAYLNLPLFKEQGLPKGWPVAAYILFTMLGLLLGLVIGTFLYYRMTEVGKNLRRIPPEEKIAVTLGTTFSLVIAYAIGTALMRLLGSEFDILVRFSLILLETVFVVWLFNVIMLSMKDEIRLLVPGMAARANANQAQQATVDSGIPKLLDTNVVIDGRIYDICRSGFLDGAIILPGFVLEELQHIADSADALRRNRGRRGLDILHQMQTDLENSVRVVDRYKVNFAAGDGVDIKLVKLAKAMSADIVTNDFNLNKVAKLHGVRVLNVNELANAVKPVVLPGEEMHVNIVREGKEYNQGVGYLDDGTMVVVENGKKMLGDTVAVSVSSVLQTVAGKMIFAELKYENGQEESDEHNGYYSSRGSRRKAY